MVLSLRGGQVRQLYTCTVHTHSVFLLSRFVSRAGSGLLVDVYGFSPVTSIACGLQLVVALVTFIYLVTCECSLVARESGLKWEDVTIVEHGRRREDQVRHAMMIIVRQLMCISFYM